MASTRTRKGGTGAGLGTASTGTGSSMPAETHAARQARIWRETRRDLMARKTGLLLVRRALDTALDDARGARYATDRDAAQVLAAILAMRGLLDAEMARVDAQMRMVEALRQPAA